MLYNYYYEPTKLGSTARWISTDRPYTGWVDSSTYSSPHNTKTSVKGNLHLFEILQYLKQKTKLRGRPQHEKVVKNFQDLTWSVFKVEKLEHLLKDNSTWKYLSFIYHKS